MRALTIRVLHGLCLAGAMVVMTGANGEGCSDPGETGGGDPTDPYPPNPCEEGTHLELICEPQPCGDDIHYGDPENNESGQEPSHPIDPDENCFEACVPDEVCPDGTQEQLVCFDDPQPYVADEPVCISENGEPCDEPPPPPPEEECFVECVPIDDCGPGFYQEWVCEGDPGDPVPLSMPCYDDDDGNCEPPPPDECYPICLPIDQCGPGFHEEFICEEPPGPPPCDPDGNCCDADGSCEDPQSGEGEDPGDIGPDDPFCDVICVPDDQGCPPGSEPIMICEEWGGYMECWEECLPTGDCPPPLVLEVVCEGSPDGQGGECFETCVDPTDPVDPGEPEPDPAN